MLRTIIGVGLVGGALLTGWSPSSNEVPAPAPHPGPGPTVPPKPSDPVPVPPDPKPVIPPHPSINPYAYLMADTATDPQHTISGVLAKIDLIEQQGLLTTDLGREVAFRIPKPELFLNLSVGQRVTLKLDDRQQAVRVMDSTAPEIPPHFSAK
ncbi:MAG: hypothetical protein H8K10_07390 [Nitrospira sp.]|nr:hypothetical protein [Nitrospira sp.]